jgi:hypothetical protein
MPKRKYLVARVWVYSCCIATLVGPLSGCSLPFLKTKEPQKAIGSTLRHDPQSGKITQAGLQAEVMDFADQYMMAIRQSLDEIISAGVDSKTRASINYGKVIYNTAAMSIAAGRNPAANLLDMVVFVTLCRISVEGHWAKVYGPEGQKLAKALRKLEKEIWTIAGQVLSPVQQEKLRGLIQAWRTTHPKQYYVANVRLNDFAALRGASPLAMEKETQGLLADVEKALVKVDEAFLLAERAMFYVERAPRIFYLQTELIMEQTTTHPDVRRVVNDVNKAVDSFASLTKTVQKLPGQFSAERKAIIKQLSDWADTERQKLWKDLEREEPRLKAVLTEVREILTAGTELTKAVGTLTTQFKSDANTPPGPPVDYVKALQHATETVKHATMLVKSLDEFIVGETAEEADLVKVLRQVNAETRALLNHAFWLGIILIVVFLIGLVAALVSYRYFTRRLVDSPRS